MTVEDMLAERRALLKRLDEAEPFEGMERLRREVLAGIRRLEDRQRMEAEEK